MKNKLLAILLAALLAIPSGLLAQKNTNDAIAKIRKDYATALEKIKAAGDYYDDIFVNRANVVIQEMWSGSGPHKETTDLYYSMGLNEEWSFDRTLFFVRSKWNVAPREFFLEILYDEKGQPEFYFFKAPGYDGNNYEFRYYWENGKLIRSLVPDNVPEEASLSSDCPTAEDAWKAALKYIDYVGKL